MPADAVQNKINDLLRLGEPLVTENGVSDGEGDGTQSAGRLHHVQSELIFVWLDQQGDGSVEQLIVGLLLGAESVVIMGLATEPQRSEQRDNPPQPVLKDDDCRTQPLLKAQPGSIWASSSQVRWVECILDDRVDQGFLGGKGTKDRSFGDTCGLGDLLSTHLAAETFEQWLGCRDERGSPLIEGNGAARVTASIVSEHSLNNRSAKRSRLFRHNGTIGGRRAVRLAERAHHSVPLVDSCEE